MSTGFDPEIATLIALRNRNEPEKSSWHMDRYGPARRRRKLTFWSNDMRNELRNTISSFFVIFIAGVLPLSGQPPTVVDPNLIVRTVVNGLNQPTTMAFLGTNDFLVLE